MDPLIFALDAVAPIIAMVAIGYILKTIGFMTPEFAKAANKLVFRLFLPCMLFLNVYRIEDLAGMDFGYVAYVLIAVLIIFAVTLPLTLAVTRGAAQRGALLQSVFRSNYALIGIPLAQSLYGDAGVTIATLLSAVVVPAFNVLAVISLSIFRPSGGKPSVKKIVLGVIKNPLIQAVLTGLLALAVRALLSHLGVGFRLSSVEPLFKVLTYLSNMATPMALLVLGAQFEFSAVSSLKREIVFGTLMRTVDAAGRARCDGRAFCLVRRRLWNARGGVQRADGTGDGQRRHAGGSARRMDNGRLGAHRLSRGVHIAAGRRVRLMKTT